MFWLFESFTQITVEGYNAAYLEDDVYGMSIFVFILTISYFNNFDNYRRRND